MCAKSAEILDLKEKVLHSALVLAEEQGWEYTTLRDIAVHAEISVFELFDLVEDKSDVLVLLGRMIDRKVLKGMSSEVMDTTSARERLFDIMMDRYEILNDHRGGLVAILESFQFDPKQMVISCPHLCRSMTWMLESSGIETSGLKGAVKVAGLTGVYLKVLRVWLKDDSPDLSQTMAALDKTLERAEKMSDMFGF